VTVVSPSCHGVMKVAWSAGGMVSSCAVTASVVALGSLPERQQPRREEESLNEADRVL